MTIRRSIADKISNIMELSTVDAPVRFYVGLKEFKFEHVAIVDGVVTFDLSEQTVPGSTPRYGNYEKMLEERRLMQQHENREEEYRARNWGGY